MLVAGEGQDKADNARRVADSGIGLDLRTAKPSAEQVRRAVDEMLAEPMYARFRERAAKLRREGEELHVGEVVGRELERLGALEAED